jgi:cardiolipin synthase A/B
VPHVTTLLAVRPPYAELSVGEHQVALLKDGGETFPRMLEAIARAKSTICLETYIFRDDHIGRAFGEALMERARAGVQVNFMFDGWGSEVDSHYVEELRRHKVRVTVFRPMVWQARLREMFLFLSRRNHRKSMVVDGEVGFLGGLNLSKDYASVEDGGSGWRDTHMELRGPAVVRLERMFLDSWFANGGEPIDVSRYARSVQHTDALVTVLGNGLAAERKDIRKAYVTAFAAAKERILLTHAYFLPPNRVLKELTKAARRGVQVRLVLAGATDVLAVLLAARGLYPKLLRSGVRVFEWEGRILHAKTGVVDDDWSTVGSSNLDAMSLRHNLEVNAVVRSEAFTDALTRMFEDDLKFCREVTLADIKQRPLVERVLSYLAYRVRAWL